MLAAKEEFGQKYIELKTVCKPIITAAAKAQSVCDMWKAAQEENEDQTPLKKLKMYMS